MKRIRVAAPAGRDLDDIWYFIARNSGSIDIANEVIDSITEAFSLFARPPEAGTGRDDIDRRLRGFPARNYIIYYRVSGQFVVISREACAIRRQRSGTSKIPMPDKQPTRT